MRTATEHHPHQADDRGVDAPQSSPSPDRSLSAEVAVPLGRVGRRHFWGLAVSVIGLLSLVLLVGTFASDRGRDRSPGADVDIAAEQPVQGGSLTWGEVMAAVTSQVPELSDADLVAILEVVGHDPSDVYDPGSISTDGVCRVTRVSGGWMVQGDDPDATDRAVSELRGLGVFVVGSEPCPEPVIPQ